MEYSIEEIEAAWSRYWPSRTPDKRTIKGVIAELTKPAVSLETEVYAYRRDKESNFTFRNGSTCGAIDVRKLSTLESGAGELLSALVTIKDDPGNAGNQHIIALEAIVKWKVARNED